MLFYSQLVYYLYMCVADKFIHQNHTTLSLRSNIYKQLDKAASQNTNTRLGCLKYFLCSVPILKSKASLKIDVNIYHSVPHNFLEIVKSALLDLNSATHLPCKKVEQHNSVTLAYRHLS